MGHLGRQTEGPAFQELIKEFEAKYPKIKVKYVNVPFDEAQNKFKTAAQAGAGAPDVMRAEVAWVAEFASLGYLQPLDGTRPLETRPTSCPTPMAAPSTTARRTRVPQVTDTLALIYNKKLLEEAGVTDGPHDLGRAEEAAARRQGQDRRQRPVLNADGYFLLPFIYGEGGDLRRRRPPRRSPSTRPQNVEGMARSSGPGHVAVRRPSRRPRTATPTCMTAFKERQDRDDLSTARGRVADDLLRARSSRTRPTSASPRSRRGLGQGGRPRRRLTTYADLRRLARTCDAANEFVRSS